MAVLDMEAHGEAAQAGDALPPRPDPFDVAEAVRVARLPRAKILRDELLHLRAECQHAVQEAQGLRGEVLQRDLRITALEAALEEARALYAGADAAARHFVMTDLAQAREEARAIREALDDWSDVITQSTVYARALQNWRRGDVGSDVVGDARHDVLRAVERMGGYAVRTEDQEKKKEEASDG